MLSLDFIYAHDDEYLHIRLELPMISLNKIHCEKNKVQLCDFKVQQCKN